MLTTSRSRRSTLVTVLLALTFAATAACGVSNDDASAVSDPTADSSATRARRAFVTVRSISDSATVTEQADRVGGNPIGTPAVPPAGAPLEGRMIGSFGGALYGADLATGRYSRLAGNGELANIGALRRDATIVTRRDRGYDSAVVLTVDDCLEAREDVVCVLFADRTGDIRDDDFFTLISEFPGPVKTSFDGQHVMINRGDLEGGSSTVQIFTRDGDLVSEWAQTGYMDRDGPYDFLPDGRVVFAREGNALLGGDETTGIYITKPYQATPDRRITFPDFYQGGAIETIETSPDGSQLLIHLAPRVGPKRPILLDLETLTITQLIDRNDGGVTDVDSVVWGPDGEWVYAVVPTSKLLSGTGTAPGTTVVFIGTFFSLFAYRADGTTHPMPSEPSDLSDSVRLIPTDNPGEPGGAVGGGQYRGDLIWIP